MPFDPRAFDIPDAVTSSQDVYEVQFTDWGVRTVPPSQTAINPNFQFPPPGVRAVPSALAAIAIGPRSTVDRCWVSWDRQKITAINQNPETGTSTESRLRPLSVDNPISFASATKAGILPSTDGAPNKNNDPQTAMHNGLLYVFPKEAGDATELISFNTTILPANYFDETGAVIPFTKNADNSDLITPYLELLLYLQPPLMALPTMRFPLVVSTGAQVTTFNVYEPVAHIPIFGRKHVGISLRNALHATDYRLGLLRCVRESQTPAPISFDAPAGSALGVAAGQSANFQLNNPCADYLNIYAKVTAASDIAVDLTAHD